MSLRALLVAITLSALATSGWAQSMQVVGYAGVLGEWELTASVTTSSNRTKEFSGPLTMRHIGICTQEGPEEKTGEIRLQVAESSLQVTLLVGGVECRYSGRLTDFYSGEMSSPDRSAVPLKLWLR